MAVEQFKTFLKKNNLNIDIIISNEQTHSAIEAANVHKVPVNNIVKSLLVKVGEDYKIFLVPGNRKLDIDLLKKDFSNENIRMANANEVKEITGYSIGGVPPFGHKAPLEIFIQDGFDNFNDIIAAAGSNNSVFKTSFAVLKGIIQDSNQGILKHNV